MPRNLQPWMVLTLLASACGPDAQARCPAPERAETPVASPAPAVQEPATPEEAPSSLETQPWPSVGAPMPQLRGVETIGSCSAKECPAGEGCYVRAGDKFCVPLANPKTLLSESRLWSRRVLVDAPTLVDELDPSGGCTPNPRGLKYNDICFPAWVALQVSGRTIGVTWSKDGLSEPQKLKCMADTGMKAPDNFTCRVEKDTPRLLGVLHAQFEAGRSTASFSFEVLAVEAPPEE